MHSKRTKKPPKEANPFPVPIILLQSLRRTMAVDLLTFPIQISLIYTAFMNIAMTSPIAPPITQDIAAFPTQLLSIGVATPLLLNFLLQGLNFGISAYFYAIAIAIYLGQNQIRIFLIQMPNQLLITYFKQSQMNNTRAAKVLKIVEGTLFHLEDIQSQKTVIVELQPAPKKPHFYHLLKTLSQKQVTYEIGKKGNKIKQQMVKGSIYLDHKPLADLYRDPETIQQCTEQKVYQRDQIIQCYIMEVECLKVKLYLLNQNKFLTLYFSQLKLPKVEHTHPKEVWQRAEQYFKSLLLGDFVQIKISGSQNYREEMNVYGEILRLHNGVDLKQKAVSDGYAELSKNCEKYLGAHEINKLTELMQQSKTKKKGIWYEETKLQKGANQIIQQKFTQWQEWIKKKQKLPNIKNIDQQIKQLSTELKKNSAHKSDPNKGRIILETVMTIFEQYVTEKNIGMLQEFIKNVIGAIVNIQTIISANTDNLDYLRYVNKLFILVLFFVLETEKLGNKNKLIAAELQKIIKIVFRCCFIGNQIFHEKVFDRRKQSDFETFQFDPAYLSGISSYSETSDIEQNEKVSKHNKTQKKITSAQTKIRINATLLISSIFKNYSSVVENHWEICVKSNILTKDFMDYLQKLKITVQPIKMTQEEKKNIASLMRTNFGDYSLVLLVFFQQNAKVKMNALNCMIHMIGNFQSRKIIDTTEAVYVQKLLNQTKSSFVPKSFIVFSGLRNALYFMLFSLHHQRNILIIINTFKALTELCQQSTLIDKMGFLEGMGLLMSNYINPVLRLSWEVKELIELKCLCIQFLGALVNTQKKWDEMESQYLMSAGEKNINGCLLKVFTESKQENKLQQEKTTTEVTKYFKNMAKRYYAAVFFEISPGVSVWTSMAAYYLKNPHPIYPTFVQQIFKCHFDQISQLKSQISLPRKIMEATTKAQSVFGAFLQQFLPVYSQIVTNQNYIGLINVLTYIPYGKWSENSLKTARQFLDHCFQSVSGEPKSKKFPSLEPLKSNSLVRLSLIKLLGYISFCKEFQNPHYSTSAIRNLLEYSRLYKSPNSVIKITWGISNWSNIDCFKQGLTANQLKECLDYMVKLSQSDKQKIASNCTRGIGFFLAKFNKDVDLQECRTAVIKNLSHPIIKVRTNSTKTLRMMVTNNLMWKENLNTKTQQLIGILQQNILKNNYHLQIQTLLLIKDLGNPIKESHMVKIYSHILHDLLSHTTMEYEFNQIKALKQLRKVVLEQMVKYPQYLSEGSQTQKQFYQTIQNFMLDSQQQSIRKEAEHSKILQRGFQKGQEALNAVFNIKKQKYDQEKMITTEFTMRGVQFQANEEDLELIEHIREVGKKLQEKGEDKQKWRILSEMRIEDRKIVLGKI